MTRHRLRDLGITIGNYPTGTYNAITDVPDLRVGHATVIHDTPTVARTGVTVLLPRAGDSWRDHCFAGFHSFNGNGEMTGMHWLEESGLLTTPIAITNTHQVGTVHSALAAYSHLNQHTTQWSLPVVAETYDGWLNDINAFHVTQDHVFEAIAAAGAGAVSEGCVGGGTGMICHDFKGGIGTSSRVVETKSGVFTIGALVQANYGDRHLLRVDGVPVGKAIGFDRVPSSWDEPPKGGSIIIIVATDAPLLPAQCKRLAQRATVGLARVGSVGHNGSGDLFLAFATGNHVPAEPDRPLPVLMMPLPHMNPLFEAVAEAVEESILNALTAATTTSGMHGRVAHALPLDLLQEVMERHRPRPGG